jgi:hypothetical protein
MNEQVEQLKYAVLIDGDNAQASLLTQVGLRLIKLAR